MKLGLIADIHETVEYLRAAIDRFTAERVDQIVVLGDIFKNGLHLEETCRLLLDANAVGVWGNHDFGFCSDGPDDFFQQFPDVVLEYSIDGVPQPAVTMTKEDGTFRFSGQMT